MPVGEWSTVDLESSADKGAGYIVSVPVGEWSTVDPNAIPLALTRGRRVCDVHPRSIFRSSTLRFTSYALYLRKQVHALSRTIWRCRRRSFDGRRSTYCGQTPGREAGGQAVLEPRREGTISSRLDRVVQDRAIPGLKG